MKECYDGYHFVEDSEGIYNPFSVLNTFYKMKFGSYWFETGTPTYLVELLKHNHYDLEQMTHEETSVDVLNSIYDDDSPIPVIYQSGYADTPYELVSDLELHYQNVVFIIFKLVGFYTEAEYHTSEGRIDLVLKTDKYIYVMEFKLEGTAEEALRQIEEKRYALPFESDSRKLFKIGVNFSNRTRNIEQWIIK